MFKRKKQFNKGFTLIELLFYISLLIVITLIVVNSLIMMIRSFRQISVNTDIVNSYSIFDRISRDIRSSSAIVSSTASSLRLNMAPLEREFVFLNGNIQLWNHENGNSTLVGNLNSQNISVIDLGFNIINSPTPSIRIHMTIKSNRYNSNKTETFYNTVSLRQNY